MGVIGDATVIRLRLSSDDVVDELHYSAVSGYILDGDDAGVVNAVVELTGDDYDAKATDSNGYYQFPEVLNGNYTLTPTKNGKTYYADHQDIAVAGADVLVDTMIEVWVVSGYIVDSVDAGIEGVTVTLSGDESGSTTTDANGFYTFSNIPNGSYTVTPAKADLEFTPDHQDITVVDADEVVTDMVGDSIHYTISGYILDGDSAGIEGVTVTLSGDESDTDTTDANGAYSFLLPDGSYTITPTLTDYTFTEDHEAVTVAGDDVVVDTMVGEEAVDPYALPIQFDWADGSGLDTAVWTDGSYPGAGTYVGDHAVPTLQLYTPSFAKCLQVRASGVGDTYAVRAYCDYFRDASKVFNKSLGLRIEWEYCREAPVDGTVGYFGITSTDGTVAFFSTFNNFATDLLASREIAPAYDQKTEATLSAWDTDKNTSRWFKHRVEINAGFTEFNSYIAKDGSSSFQASGAKTIVTNISAIDFDRIFLTLYRRGDGYGLWTKFWIGTAADAWPT